MKLAGPRMTKRGRGRPRGQICAGMPGCQNRVNSEWRRSHPYSMCWSCSARLHRWGVPLTATEMAAVYERDTGLVLPDTPFPSLEDLDLLFRRAHGKATPADQRTALGDA